jgi:hypothetical protein
MGEQKACNSLRMRTTSAHDPGVGGSPLYSALFRTILADIQPPGINLGCQIVLHFREQVIWLFLVLFQDRNQQYKETPFQSWIKKHSVIFLH